MPRLARLDAPGVLHHIIIRGIERRKIFRDDKDRDNFIDRLSDLLPATQTACYAWAFIPNHAHFLFRSGSSAGISNLMRRLLTGYAIYFNRRYRRHGQLFQNRYKSIICQEDMYFKELVRYIHLNPYILIVGRGIPPHVPSKTWRELIKKVWEVDPLTCPRCGSEMKIISLIQDPDVIRQILKHLGLWKQDAGSRCKKPKSGYGSVVHEDFDDGWPGYEEPTITFH